MSGGTVVIDPTPGSGGGSESGPNGGEGHGNPATDEAAQLDLDQLSVADAQTAADIKRAAGIPIVLAPGAAAPAVPAPTLATKPGKERWAIKTGVDSDVGLVQKRIVTTAVEELIAAARPNDMLPPTSSFPEYDDQRAQPLETTIWRLDADVVFFKLEKDGDFHLVLQGDSGAQMIGEVPTGHPPFVKNTSPWLSAIAAARKAVSDQLSTIPAQPFIKDGQQWVPAPPPPGTNAPPSIAFLLGEAEEKLNKAPGAPGADAAAAPGAPPEGPQVFAAKIKNQRARFTGVGFFDRVHGQNGVAANGVELHPILKVEWL